MTTAELERQLEARPGAKAARKRLESMKEILERFAPEPSVLTKRSDEQWVTGEEAAKQAIRAHQSST